MFDSIKNLLSGGPSSANEQSNDEVQLASYVRSKVDESRGNGSRVAQEGVWMTNIAYLMGFTSVYWNVTSKQYQNVDPGSRGLKRNRIYVNKILPTIQNRLSRLCKNPPQFDIRPESNDVDDKDAARLGMDIIKMIWDKEHVNEKRLSLGMWLQQCGYAFMKISWDPTMGKPMVDPSTGERLGNEGDIRCEPTSSFEVFQDPTAKSLDECAWVAQAKVRKLNYFKEHYEGKGELVKEESSWLLSLQYENRINNLSSAGPGGSGGGAAQQQMQDSAIEIAYYERASKKHPYGRMVIVANGIILEDKELPCGEIPFVKFDDVIIGGRFAGESIITHLRPIQDQYNRTISKRAEWTNRMLAGKYIAPKGHGMHVEALNDTTEVVQYNPGPNGQKPEAMQVPAIPQYAYMEEDKLEGMMLDISGINEVSRGQLPSASIPAAGMAILQEQDQTRIGVMCEQHEQSWAKYAQLILKFVQAYYKTDRVLKIAGDNLEYTVKKFTGSDIKDNHDVICIRGSTVPTSKELRRQEILNAYQQGILGDPKDPKLRQKVLGMLEYGEIAEIWNDQALDQNQVKEHLDMVEAGKAPPREELDNHVIHIQDKNKYRKTDKFKRLDTLRQQILRDDIEWHVQAIVGLTNPQLQMQQDLAGHAVDAANNQPMQPPPSPADLVDPNLHPAMQQPGPMQPPMQGAPQGAA